MTTRKPQKDPEKTAEATPEYFSLQVFNARRFHLSHKSTDAMDIAVVSAGCEHCDTDYRIARKTFPFLSFEYVARGKGSLVLNSKTYDLVPGTLFSYGPGIAQTIHTDPDDRMVKYFVDFAGRRGHGLMKDAAIPPGTVIQISRPNEMAEAFDRLITEGLRESPFRNKICASLLEYLILKAADTAIPYGSSGTRAFYTYQKCLQHIEDNYHQLFSAEQIASECFVDQAYLCRLFKRFGRYTPYQQLIRLKMNRAAELLQEPGKLVKQVSDELNFADPYHFSRVFKRVHGIPPEQLCQRRDDS